MRWALPLLLFAGGCVTWEVETFPDGGFVVTTFGGTSTAQTKLTAKADEVARDHCDPATALFYEVMTCDPGDGSCYAARYGCE